MSLCQFQGFDLPDLFSITLTCQFLPQSLPISCHSPRTGTSAGAQRDPAVDHGQFDLENSLCRLMLFFEQMGNDWAMGVVPIGRGHCCSLCGEILRAAITSALTQLVKGVCKAGS